MMKKDRQLAILTFIIGTILLTIGIIYEIIDKSDGWKGIIAGIVILGISVVIFFFNRNRKGR